jgi:hypothetical protein
VSTDLMTERPTECLAPMTDLMGALNSEGIVPASITCEWRHTDQTHPYVNVWLRYRTDLERLAKRLGLRVESGVRVIGQRHYWTKGDGPGVLLQCVSLPHHDDFGGDA